MLTLLDLLRSLPSRGDNTAMIYRTGVRRREYSYERLYELSLKMNSWFSRNGIENGDRVLLWGPNSPWWSIAFWGCVARGAVIVPVDFMSGRDRAENIARLTGAKLAIQSRHKPERLTNLQSLLMEDLAEILNDME
ncbi:long-chain fatty acid--CoA ligase, partial [bacterium]